MHKKSLENAQDCLDQFLLRSKAWLSTLIMDPNDLPGSKLKAAILTDSQIFLAGLHAGASEEQLNVILARIKDTELRLMANHGLKLSPEVWNMLRTRLLNRKPKDIIDGIHSEPMER